MKANLGSKDKHTVATIGLFGSQVYVKDDTPESCKQSVNGWRGKKLTWRLSKDDFTGNPDWVVTLYADKNKTPLDPGDSPFEGGQVTFQKGNHHGQIRADAPSLDYHYGVEVTGFTGIDPKLIIYDPNDGPSFVKSRIGRILEELEELADLAFDRLDLGAIKDFVQRLEGRLEKRD